MTDLTHFDDEGKAIMVDVGDKKNTRRVAVARGVVKMQAETLTRKRPVGLLWLGVL